MNNDDIINSISNTKLTPKKSKLLEVLADPAFKKDTLTSKLKRVGITHQYYYQLMKDPEFLKLLKLRNICTVVSYSPHIVRSVVDKAMNGNFMQQRLALEMSGDYSPQAPLINILINNNQQPKEDIDTLIINKIIDTLPAQVVTEDTDV